jgi:hypothetical protein
VYGDEALWCYLDNDGVAGGDCADVMATCESYRQTAITNSVVFTIGKLKQEFGFEKAKQQAIESALKRWRRCAPTFVAACFYWTDVLSNVEVRMCNPTLAASMTERSPVWIRDWCSGTMAVWSIGFAAPPSGKMPDTGGVGLGAGSALEIAESARETPRGSNSSVSPGASPTVQAASVSAPSKSANSMNAASLQVAVWPRSKLQQRSRIEAAVGVSRLRE